ncbi:GNAT family N-acetyltransferase [Sporosarcina sp. Sa2YVA2]|uniref:GNAT family N-acetyltransferase n=1 Tax=Sporosarcina quadrami TaxID=2762234 RepID=A0ABR8U7V4_9BACL|nr:GNAT family protein [Sporosarcina quadrami]MBD7984113.1 GNAT family N-acetyltransferase [Sporosarcina quadrami]
MDKVFPILETDRLLLREVKMEDAKSVFYYLSDKEVMKYYGMAPMENVCEAEEEIAWYRRIFDEGTGIRWGITLKDTSEVIGSCGFLQYTAQHARTEVGLELSKEYWKSGIMTEALTAVIQYGFSHMELMRIQALIDPENIASQKLFEKLGFLQEGLLRKYERTNGKFEDVHMYSLLKDEYNAAVLKPVE